MPLTAGQQRCVDTLDRSIVVAAGAGSGKTFTLARRIINAFDTGVIDDIDQVLAITFTKKAAGELKSHIKGALRASGRTDQALKVDEAWISTIHGMCSRILKAHAVELGIDPSFKVAEGSEIDRFLKDSIDVTFKELRVEGDEAADALFREYRAAPSGDLDNGVTVTGMLKKLVEVAASTGKGADAFVCAPPARSPEAIVVEAMEQARNALAMASGQKQGKTRDGLIAGLQGAIDAADAVVGVRDLTYADAFNLVGALPKMGRSFGSAEFKDYAVDTYGNFARCAWEARLAWAQTHLDTLIAVTRRSLGRFASSKQAAGVLDNNDLLTMASAAIADHPDIAALYADKFKLIMVDEFQDTDQMQVDMISRLAGPNLSRLCTVGDAQQSIYRFRGADVSVFRHHRDEVGAADPQAVIEFPENFRSHGDVLAFVRAVFGQSSMFGGEFMDLKHGRDESLVKHPYLLDGPRIFVQEFTRDASKRGSDVKITPETVRALQADAIADKFAEFAQAGHSLGDMVILLGNMKKADCYAAALRSRGMACVIAGGSVFASSAEAATVAALLRFMANPHETAALYQVLSSSMFNLSDSELLELASYRNDEGEWAKRPLDRGFFSCVRALREHDGDEGISARLAIALEVLSGLLAHASSGSIAAALDGAVTASGWVARCQAQGGEGTAEIANVYKGIRIVEDLESSEAIGISNISAAFADHLAGSKEKPGALSASGGDFVRIMTVHASKGLEFPIVAVSELRADTSPSGKFVLESVGGTVYVSLDLDKSVKGAKGVAASSLDDAWASFGEDADDEDSLASELKSATSNIEMRVCASELGALGENEEAKRLLYVALTRAKEALVVSLRGAVPTAANQTMLPAGADRGIVIALERDAANFPEGTKLYDFGGAAPCEVTRAHLTEARVRAALEEEQQAASGETVAEGFAVPPYVSHPPLNEAVYRPARDGVFSYSSVSEASHEEDFLDSLAAAYAQESDGAPDDERTDGGALARELGLEDGAPAQSARLVLPEAFLDEGDEASLASFGIRSEDADKATDLGTAFHRLAQYAVNARKPGEALAYPPEGRVDALARSCMLGRGARARLQTALARWFASTTALEMASFADLRAEVPFSLEIKGGDLGEPAYLEGEIDLIAFDEGNKAAHVVDYKTGGREDESDSALRRKHVLQAVCYAFAVLNQGYDRVDATFVRVEQPTDQGEPQRVVYRFTAADLPALEEAVAHAWSLAKE